MTTIHLTQCVCGGLHDSYSVLNCGPAQRARAEAAEKALQLELSRHHSVLELECTRNSKALEMLLLCSDKAIAVERARTEKVQKTAKVLEDLLREARPFINTWDRRREVCESCGVYDCLPEPHSPSCILTKIDIMLASLANAGGEANTACQAPG